MQPSERRLCQACQYDNSVFQSCKTCGAFIAVNAYHIIYSVRYTTSISPFLLVVRRGKPCFVPKNVPGVYATIDATCTRCTSYAQTMPETGTYG